MDNKFRPDSRRTKPIEAKQVEFSFNEGVTESLKIIRKLHNKLKRDVFVIIDGSDTNVGKTYLFGVLAKDLMSSGIPAYGNISIPYKKDEKIKRVFFTHDSHSFYGTGIDFGDKKDADLLIAIYRPGKEFSPSWLTAFNPDIMIRNEKAKDSPTKIGYKKPK